MKHSIIIIIIALFSSCTNNPKTSRNQESIILRDSRANEKKTSEISIDSILAYNRVVHAFSEQKQMDTFLIVIKGKSLTVGIAEFIIKDSMGKEIYYASFPSSYLLNFDLKEDASEQDKNDFILERVNQFFKEGNFRIPAIGTSETFDEDYSDKDIWEEIKADQSAIGFYYLVGEEDGISIAYSKIQKKTVMYFNCC
jgi:hypothetical protein